MNVLVWAMPGVAMIVVLALSMQSAHERIIIQATGQPHPVTVAINAQIRNALKEPQVRASQTSSRPKNATSCQAKANCKTNN